MCTVPQNVGPYQPWLQGISRHSHEGSHCYSVALAMPQPQPLNTFFFFFFFLQQACCKIAGLVVVSNGESMVTVRRLSAGTVVMTNQVVPSSVEV